MYYVKKLIFFILCFGTLLSIENRFRGLDKQQILRSKIPFSFAHHIADNYDILPQQLTPVRGGYLIIAREGLVEQGFVDVFAEFKMNKLYRNETPIKR